MANRKGLTISRLRSLAESVIARPMAITEAGIHLLATQAERILQVGAGADAAAVLRDVREEMRAELQDRARPMAVALSYGVPLEGASRATVRDGVAIIPVVGALYHYENLCTELCGATAYEQIAQDVDVALNTPGVTRLFFYVDSPGGEVAGCGETAGLIAEAAQQKPTMAYTPDLMCSGGYWLGSAAGSAGGRLVGAPTDISGSIGVRMAVTDTSKRDANEGIRNIVIVSDQSPRKALDPTTPEGEADARRILNALAAVFVSDVAKYRRVSEAKVLSDFGQGGVFVGQDAVDAGLLDGLSTFEQAFADFASTGPQGRGLPAEGGIISSTTAPTEPPMDLTTKGAGATGTITTTPPAADTPVTAASVTASHPAVAAELRAEGATQERERITAIRGATLPGHDALAETCIQDPTVSAGDFALRQAAAARAALGTTAAAIQKDEAAVAGLAEVPSAGGASGSGTPASGAADARATAKRVMSVRLPARGASRTTNNKGR